MATITDKNNKVIEITFSGAVTDWDFSTEMPDDPDGVRVQSIEFHPSGADTFKMRQGSLTGPSIFQGICSDSNDARIKYFDGALLKPYLEADDQTYNSLTAVTIIITLFRDQDIKLKL